MKFIFTSALVAVSCLAEENGYSAAQAEISRQLSSDTYCNKENYLSHTYEGAAKGFVATYVVEQPLYDVQGYVGYLPSDKSIYVAYKGSDSINNWVTDFDAT